MRAFSLADVGIGTVLPSSPERLITRDLLSRFAVASGDHNAIRLDPNAARAAGLTDVIAPGMLSMGFLGLLITEWVPVADLLSFQVRFAATTPVGAWIRCGATVEDIMPHGDQWRARLSLDVRIVDGPVTVRGRALVRIAL